MNPIREFFQVLAVIFPLTLFIPPFMQPMLDKFELEATAPLAVLTVDIVIVGCAVFVFLPLLNRLVERLRA